MSDLCKCNFVFCFKFDMMQKSLTYPLASRPCLHNRQALSSLCILVYCIACICQISGQRDKFCVVYNNRLEGEIQAYSNNSLLVKKQILCFLKALLKNTGQNNLTITYCREII
jgi:hypothetical protein